MVEDYSRDQLRNIAYECGKSNELFAYTMLPHLFIGKSKLHTELFDALDRLERGDFQRLALKAPRGIGKTTALLSFILKQIVYRRMNCLAQASASVSLAKKDAEGVKEELLNNKLIKSIFGTFKPESRTTHFSQDNWVTSAKYDREGSMTHAGTQVTPISWTASIRGLFHMTPLGKFRPDGIIADDMEDPQEVASDNQRAKIQSWLDSCFKNLVQFYDVRGDYEFVWWMIVSGTMLHDDCLIERCCRSGDYETVELSICNDKFETNAPEFVSTERLAEERAEYEKAGRTHIWYQERMGLSMDPETAEFKPEYFHTFEEKDIQDTYFSTHAILLDTARTIEKNSCETAIVGVSFAPEENTFYVRDLVHGKLQPAMITGKGTPTESLLEVYNMADRLSNSFSQTVIGYERTGLGLYIEYPLESFQRERGSYYILEALDSTGNKDDRIMALAPMHRMGRFKYAEGIVDQFKLQLTRMPAAAKKDIADALAFILQLMGKGRRYFNPTNDASKKKFEDKMLVLRKERYNKMPPARRIRMSI